MSLLKNSTIVIAGVVVSNLLAYVFHFIAGRMLGPEDYGVFGALMALFLLISLPAGALSFAITKYTARFNSNDEHGKIALLRKKIQNGVLIFSTGLLVIIVVFSKIIADFLKINSSFSVIIVGIVLTFALLLPVNRGILQGMKNFRVYAWNFILEAFFRVVLLALFLYFGFGVNGAILAYGVAFFIAFLLVFPHIKENKKSILAEEKLEIKPIYRFVFQVLAVNIILQLLVNIPSVFIKHFYSNEFTGYWTAALNLARISLFITASISLVMFPEIAREKDRKNKTKIFYRASILVLLASSFVALLLFMIPQFLIQILYGKSYIGAVPILQWMGVAMIFIGLLQLRADYFLANLK